MSTWSQSSDSACFCDLTAASENETLFKYITGDRLLEFDTLTSSESTVKATVSYRLLTLDKYF